MPPKNGPATPKKATGATPKDVSTDDAAPSAPEPSETATDTVPKQELEPASDGAGAVEQSAAANLETEPDPAADAEVKAAKDSRMLESIKKLYPEDADLWIANIDDLVFAFPRITTLTPSRQWLRQIYQLTEMAQTFEWMLLAKVPMEIQNLTDMLTDQQYSALFRAWFVDGEVTLPK